MKTICRNISQADGRYTMQGGSDLKHKVKKNTENLTGKEHSKICEGFSNLKSIKEFKVT